MVKEFNESQLFLIFLARETLKGVVSRTEAVELNQLYADLVIHKAGFVNANPSDPAFMAVDRQAIKLMQKRLVELHPELEADLERYLAKGPGRV